jgi:hypothetical protein
VTEPLLVFLSIHSFTRLPSVSTLKMDPKVWLVLGLLLVLLHIIRRVYFHALSRYPGHWCAAATSLFEFYHNVVRQGRYVDVIDTMHKRYGIVLLMLYPNRSTLTYNMPYRSDWTKQTPRQTSRSALYPLQKERCHKRQRLLQCRVWLCHRSDARWEASQSSS